MGKAFEKSNNLLQQPPQDLTNNLTANIRGIDNIEVMDLQQAMTNWWIEYPCVPEYVNHIKYGQKKAARMALPISE